MTVQAEERASLSKGQAAGALINQNGRRPACSVTFLQSVIKEEDMAELPTLYVCFQIFYYVSFDVRLSEGFASG